MRKLKQSLFFPRQVAKSRERTPVFFKPYITDMRSRDRAVGTATGYGLDDRGGRSSSHGKVKNVLHVVHTCSGAHPASNGYRGLFPRG
jgi:hypothetical protein